MYTKAKNITSNKQDLSNYIEGFDVYNARILDLIREYDRERVDYLIKAYDFRPDLIAKDIYGDEKYLGIFLISCPIGLANFRAGNVIRILPKTVIDNILFNL